MVADDPGTGALGDEGDFDFRVIMERMIESVFVELTADEGGLPRGVYLLYVSFHCLIQYDK